MKIKKFFVVLIVLNIFCLLMARHPAFSEERQGREFDASTAEMEFMESVLNNFNNCTDLRIWAGEQGWDSKEIRVYDLSGNLVWEGKISECKDSFLKGRWEFLLYSGDQSIYILSESDRE